MLDGLAVSLPFSVVAPAHAVTGTAVVVAVVVVVVVVVVFSWGCLSGKVRVCVWGPQTTFQATDDVVVDRATTDAASTWLFLVCFVYSIINKVGLHKQSFCY
ncbi:unnamed protein product [Polarella glacialis]|uniref:Uncharacterized protein n=1 Tax=Polarella glacialis TaxID=89957 RepID=A0A813FMP0_POLGL|nr:unnamed protein product [Polarella glacialis]